MTAAGTSLEPPEGAGTRWPLMVAAILLLVVAAGGAAWLLRGVDPVGVWVGHLDTLGVELHVEEDGTFEWFLRTPGAETAQNAGRGRAPQWTGTWRLSEGELVMHYAPKPPRNEAGVRYGRFSDGVLRTTFGLGGERTALRRHEP